MPRVFQTWPLVTSLCREIMPIRIHDEDGIADQALRSDVNLSLGDNLHIVGEISSSPDRDAILRGAGLQSDHAVTEYRGGTPSDADVGP